MIAILYVLGLDKLEEKLCQANFIVSNEEFECSCKYLDSLLQLTIQGIYLKLNLLRPARFIK